MNDYLETLCLLLKSKDEILTINVEDMGDYFIIKAHTNTNNTITLEYKNTDLIIKDKDNNTTYTLKDAKSQSIISINKEIDWILDMNNNFIDDPKIMKYFSKSIDYPDISGVILPFGTEYNYVSSQFLDGFINYYSIIKAYLLNRYNKWEEQFEEQQYQRISSSINSSNIKGRLTQCNCNNSFYEYAFNNKKDLFEALILPEATPHTHFSDFCDDVILLGKNKNEYIYFWYDCDCSDCSIGRFKTEETSEEVLAEFDRWINHISEEGDYNPIKEIPLDAIKGWKSF